MYHGECQISLILGLVWGRWESVSRVPRQWKDTVEITIIVMIGIKNIGRGILVAVIPGGYRGGQHS